MKGWNRLKIEHLYWFREKSTPRFVDLLYTPGKSWGITPFLYQAKLLEDGSKRVVACMGRQTGKTTTIDMKAIIYADTNAKATVLITSPSLRQSMIMFDRITRFIFSAGYL